MRPFPLAVILCALALARPLAARAADDAFPVVDDPLLVPLAWAGEQARMTATSCSLIEIVQDKLLEPWGPERVQRAYVADDAQLDCDCDAVCDDVLTPAEWAR